MVVLTKKNISVTLTGSPTVTTLDDGNFLVHVGTGSQAVTAWTPAETGSGSTRRNGGSINLPGNVGDYPFDGRYHYDSTYGVALPLTCVAGDVVLIGKSAASPVDRARASYWGMLGRSHLDEMLAISFVGYPQAANQMGLFRLGSSAGVRTLRGMQILTTQLNISSLPSIVDLATISGDPAWSYFEDLTSDFCGDVSDNWHGDRITPDLQFMGYGSYVASTVSQIMVMLCSTANTATKTQLAINVATWGSDMWSAFLDGRLNRVEGGHAAGRKALIMMAGFLLGNSAMMNPDAALGAPTRFVENDAFRKFVGSPYKWWFDSPVWDRKHVFKYNAGTQGENLLVFPETNTTWNSTDTLGFTGYMPHVAGAQVGNVLAMRLLGLEAEYGIDICTFIDQWMATPGSGALSILNSARPEFSNITWGEDYAEVAGQTMCAQAYTAYNP